MTQAISTAPVRRKLLLPFVGLLLLVPLLALTVYRLQLPTIEQETYQNLQGVAHPKSQQIENWLTERQHDGLMLTRDEGFIKLVSDLMLPGQQVTVQGRVPATLDQLRFSLGFNSILLLNSNGQLLLALGEHQELTESTRQLALQAFSRINPQHGELLLDHDSHPYLDWAVPLFTTDNRVPVGTIILRSTPEQFLYPLIQTWPTASDTAETLLVRQDGDEVVYLNELRHRKNTALKLRRSLKDRTLPAVQAALDSRSGIASGPDYRGVPVLTAYQAVAGTKWRIVAKVDRAEILEPLYTLIFWVGLVAMGAVVSIAAILSVVWRQQRKIYTIETNLIAKKLDESDASLRQSQELTQALVDSALDGVISMNESGVIIRWNAQAEKIFGYPAADALGRDLTELIVPLVHREAHRAGLSRYLASRIPKIVGQRVEVAGLRADGTEFPMELTISSLFLGERCFFSAYVRDITKRKALEQSLKIAATAFESMEGMVVTDAGINILKVNNAFTEITGYSEAEVIGKNPSLLSSGRHDSTFFDAMWASLNTEHYWFGEIWNRRKSGEHFPELLRITAILDGNGQISNYVAAFTDISDQKKTAEVITTLEFYDPLTHLANRRLMMERLQKILDHIKEERCHGAILSIDLDHFKMLNDTQGHEIGDLMLIEVANRLRTCIHAEDTLARIGGDEFVILLDALAKPPLEATSQVEAVAERVRYALTRPFEMKGSVFHSSGSIGIMLFADNETQSDELFKRADSAMHQAKQAGRNTLRFFDPATQAALESRVMLESWLRIAIPEQFRLYYQPQVDEDGRIQGAEALIRWLHPENGLISPAMFIPLAEETDLILPLGYWVLETACKQIKAWESDPRMEQLQLAVNVSAKQFHEAGFVSKVYSALESSGANPTKLKLELTESLLVDDVEAVIRTMIELKSRGISFSLDDFGTGFSSLSYLKRLPLDQVKIDQSFVRNLLNDANDEAIVRTVIGLGQSMGLAVIAEGVEKEAQRDFLLTHGCRNFQGYLFGKPMPLELFEHLVLKD